MSVLDGGGAAFPSGELPMEDCKTAYTPGLTKREYFAAQVMMGFASRVGTEFGFVERYAEAAFKFADAMIAASKSEVDHG